MSKKVSAAAAKAAKNYGNRALSISQPWAWATTDLGKRVENRSRPNKKEIAGGLWIHTGAKEQRGGTDALYGVLDHPEANKLDKAICAGELVRGYIVAHCQMSHCLSLEEYHAKFGANVYAEGPYCYPLGSVQKLREPVPFKGKLGFWTLPDKVIGACVEQLEPLEAAEVSPDTSKAANEFWPPQDGTETQPGGAGFEGEPDSNRKPSEIKGDGRMHGAKPHLPLTPAQVEALEEVLDAVTDLSLALVPRKRALEQATEKADKAKKAVAAISFDRKKLLEHLVAIRSGKWQTRLELGG